VSFDVSPVFAVRAVLPFALALAGAAGCASRSVPDAPPSASAASTTAAEGPRASVTAALDSDPPPPGTPDPRWPGLHAPKPGAAGGAHHHQHVPEGASHAR